jgi:uncharacterized cofD-like protein
MRRRVAILGGGHGVAAVLHALREAEIDLTVIVTTADDGGSSGALRRRWGSPAVGDMRRSLIALTDEDTASGRALAAPVSIVRLGEHPLGNLVLCSLTKAFGDLETASRWLTGELGLSAQVLPATREPVSLVATAAGSRVRGESTIGTALNRIERLGFEPERPDVSPRVIDAIGEADWVLLGPGSLFTSVLAVGALPDIKAALARTRAHVLWICNLVPQIPETANMSAADHFAALAHHGVRVDGVLYDPAARLHFTPCELATLDLHGLGRPLMSPGGAGHDPARLGSALHDLFSGRAGAARRPAFIE